MAFTETYRCDVCGKPRGAAEDWWLASTEPAALVPKGPEQPMLKVTPWNMMLSHARQSPAPVRSALRADVDGTAGMRGE